MRTDIIAAVLAAPFWLTTLQPVCAAETITVDGVARSYIYSNPSGRSGPRPIVIALHGGGGTAARLVRYFGWEPVAFREGFAVVYPQGLDNTWNDGRGPAGRMRRGVEPGNDVAFLTALVARLVREGRADPHRVYLTGLSNGGFMTVEMACRADGPFAAFAALVATAPTAATQTCRPSRPVPFALMAGTADRLIPYDGGVIRRAGRVSILSAPQTAAMFASLNGCVRAPSERRLPDSDPNDGSTITLLTHGGCAAEVRLYRVEGGGHQPPGNQRGPAAGLLDTTFGPRNRDIDAAEELWAFFRRFTR